jgi:hypothetical protein
MLNARNRIVAPLPRSYYRGHSSGSADYQQYIVGSRNRLPRRSSWLKRMVTALRSTVVNIFN